MNNFDQNQSQNCAENKMECCPKFDPTSWQDKEFEWKDKKFVKDKVFTFVYMPLNFGAVISRNFRALDKRGAICPDWLCLSEHTSKWNMNIYLATDKEVDGLENTTFSGKFYSRVYEGNFKETGRWGSDYETVVKNKGLKIEKQYMWYTTCPKCAKKYGKNYVVFIGKIL